MRILIVEDDVDLAESIKESLKTQYIVDTTSLGNEGAFLAQTNDYSLIIVDIGLPDMDGIELCKLLRTGKVFTPILMLTGQTDTRYVVSSLDSGADDYMKKPFIFQELRARINALIRRQHESVFLGDVLQVEDLVVDVNKRLVTRGNKIIHLRKKEFDLLELLMRNAGRVVTRDRIIENAWYGEEEIASNVVEVHMGYLRKAIDADFVRKLIKTVHGTGYKLEGGEPDNARID